MNWHLMGTAYPLYVEFLQEGEFVIPDPGSIFLTIRDNAGEIVAGYNGLALADTLVSTLTYSIPQEVNTPKLIGTPGNFETRYVRVDFSSAGRPLSSEQIYRIAGFVPLTATPAEVRALFGARDKELPDSDIDLMGAYFMQAVGYPTVISPATLSDSLTAWDANRFIVLTAGVQVAPSMPSRVLKEETMDTATQIRATIDWQALQQQILDELGVVLDRLKATVAGGATVVPTGLFVLSNRTDPVTNA